MRLVWLVWLAPATHIPYTGTMTDATGPRRGGAFTEFLAALLFLTRLPVRLPGPWTPDLDARALAWFPICGVLIGALGAALYYGFARLGLTPPLAALLVVAALMLVTGALHEDGLADFADGLGGGRDPASRLAIMKDSRIGTYGAAALLVSLGTRVAALAALGHPHAVALALLGAHAYARALLPGLKYLLPEARRDGHSARMGRPNSARALAAFLAGLLLASTTLSRQPMPSPLAALLALVVPVAGVAVVALLARRHLGGVTGDVLGAAEQVAEAAFLLCLVAALTPTSPA